MLDLDRSIIQKWLINKQSPVVVGVSGGPDSMALLFALVANGVPVVVAHVNHGLREDSSLDCEFVKNQTKKMRLAFYSTSLDVKELAKQRKLSLELAGRQARYKYFFTLALKLNAQAVAVGHTADDQAETFLMHLLRGSGMDGLSGMRSYSLPNEWSSTVPLVRPFLGIFREQILEYCQSEQIPFREDLSNSDPVFFRNRIRHEVLPYLGTINPNIKSSINKTAGLLADEAAYLDREMEKTWSGVVHTLGETQFRLSRKALIKLPVALQRRMWRKLIRSIHKSAESGYDMVEMAVRITNSGKTTGRIDLGKGMILYLADDRAWLAQAQIEINDPDWPLCKACGESSLILTGKNNLANSWAIEADWVRYEFTEKIQFPEPQNQVLIQGLTQETEIILRCRRPGDRFAPFGLQGHTKKLAEFMIDEKIPAPARDRWPLICVKNMILWVPGYARSNHYLVKDNAAPILQLVLSRDRQVG